MFSSLAIVAAFVASVSAIAVTSPGTSKTWTNDGSQSITWTAVDSDPSNFTIVLTNTNRALMPTNNQILKALVLTNALSTTVDPPSEGWPAVGGTYRVNFCKSSEELNTILAQSNEFNITAAPIQSGSSTTTTTGAKTATSLGTTPTGAGSAGTAGSASGDAGVDAGASDSDSAPAPTGTSAALPAMGMHTGFIGALVLLGALFA